MSLPAVFRPLQAKFLTIPQTPLCYWLRERFFELLAGKTLGDVADVCQGLATADAPRFVRFTWEVPLGQWARDARGRRWVPFEKGGGYAKWFGHHFWAVDWEHAGARIKATPGPRVQNEERYFKEGWTYSYMARGSLGLRYHDVQTLSSHLASAIFFHEHSPGRAAIVNCRFSSAIVRSLSAKIQLNESYVSRVLFPDAAPKPLVAAEFTCIALKRWLVALDLSERSFAVAHQRGGSLAAAHECAVAEAEAVAAVLHALEGISEREVFAAYGIAGDDMAAVPDETGTPAGWHPLIEGYDQLPPLPEGLEVPTELLDRVTAEPRHALSTTELSSLKRRLQTLYEAGPGAHVEAEEDESATEGEDENEEEAAVSGARIPIPAETFLEELSQKLEIHPISVYWLLRELRAEGVVCRPELRRFVEDYFSVMILRLLGHRWPRQIESGEPPAPWQDRDGIIPITEGTGEPPLLTPVRERLVEDFGPDLVNAVEAEFGEIMGKPLSEWLASGFFRRHTAQFRKRPIAWQIESAPEDNGGRRRQGRRRRAPVFSCLVYYHRLDADLLPKLRSQYVGPLRARLQTELAGLEKMKDRTADQEERRLELEDSLQELKAFDARLEQVVASGFACSALDSIAAQEPLDKWTSWDGRSPAPASREAFLAQERRYDPDLNDGVRVNIAPLQRAGLLAADVLAAKDVEQAIADRAAWRADERRWCREGKLPQPGWWVIGANQA